jgi:hypothetical protein
MQGEILFLLVKTCKSFVQQNRAMFLSKREDIFAHDTTFKKHGQTTSRRPREKRLIGNTEKARVMESSSNR